MNVLEELCPLVKETGWRGVWFKRTTVHDVSDPTPGRRLSLPCGRILALDTSILPLMLGCVTYTQPVLRFAWENIRLCNGLRACTCIACGSTDFDPHECALDGIWRVKCIG